jgi:uncharacterized protein YPO0396
MHTAHAALQHALTDQSQSIINNTCTHVQFVDELVAERSLKDEMLSVFTVEAAVLEGLAAVEADMATSDVQADPDKMEEAINRLAQLQEDAQRLKVRVTANRYCQPLLCVCSV